MRKSGLLKRTLSLGLACILAVAGVLVGSANVCYAAEGTHAYKEWSTRMFTPSSSTYADVATLFYGYDEQYKWTVTSYSTASGYGLVTLDGDNVTVSMLSGTNQMTSVGTKYFTVSDLDASRYNGYAAFLIMMSYDSYPTTFYGTIELLQ